ncbi:MATE family efflux transporter [Bacillus rubiinfantis]|uniref:MATE family efflux transporter n=1 Tax=Bacillus rubiinfantis TaxID=1499680 RepID=UPI000A63808E|nr:MATE family efflux transporter [Bacillus rubiinfantis]
MSEAFQIHDNQTHSKNSNGDENSLNSMETQDRELGTKPIKSLYAKYSIATLIGMLAQAVMVIFEGVIIGNGLGTLGLATISVIMPLEMLNLALGGFFGIGVASVAAIKLGKNDSEGAKAVFAQCFWFCVIFVTALSALVFFSAEGVASLLGATPDIHSSVVTFIKIFICGYPFLVTGQLLVFVLRADEKPGLASFFMTGSAALALVELYLSVIVFDVGIKGAAVYYVLSIGLWFLSIFYFLFSKNTIFKIKPTKIQFSVIGAALKTGTPYFIVQIASFIYTIVINNLLGKLGSSVDIAAFAVINAYIIYIFMMICTAMMQGMQPLASYNYGALKMERVKELVRVSIISNFVFIAVLTVISVVFAKPITSIFAAGDASFIDITSKYTIIVISLSAFGLTSVLVSGFFQAIDKVNISTVIGVSRYVIFAIPLMFIMAKPLGIMGVWYSQPIADFLACAFAMYYVFREVKNLKKAL